MIMIGRGGKGREGKGEESREKKQEMNRGAKARKTKEWREVVDEDTFGLYARWITILFLEPDSLSGKSSLFGGRRGKGSRKGSRARSRGWLNWF